MTNLKDARVVQGIPWMLRKNDNVKAFSNAVATVFKIILELEKKTDIFISDDALTDSVCNLIGKEWRVPRYSFLLTLDVKRKLIKETLTLFSTAGTVSAVTTIVETIFGSADLKEWFEYGGKPGYFSVTTDRPSTSHEDVENFKEAAESMKRLSAWLETVELGLNVPEMPVYTAGYIREYEQINFTIK